MKEVLTKINNRFDIFGIFPSDYELSLAIEGNPNYDDIYDLELEMLERAMKKKSHPYNHMV